MLNRINTAAAVARFRIQNAFRQVFKEQAGGAEVIATIVIIGIVLALALVFKDKLASLVSSLWDGVVKGDPDTYDKTKVESW